VVARQLHLFKSKRQRGVVVRPRTSEFQLQCQVADALRLNCSKHWRYSHIGHGEKRDPVTAMRLKRMGLMPGVPDFMFIGPGILFFLELKRPGGGGRLSVEQADWAQHIMRCGFGYHLAEDYADALGSLRDLGIVRARVSA
jgi:hypothetical protein